MNLYSMELGYPTLYAELNKSIRTLDDKNLKMLGPLCAVIGDACAVGEKNREDNERTPWGRKVNPNLYYNMGGLVTLFRGGQLKPEWID